LRQSLEQELILYANGSEIIRPLRIHSKVNLVVSEYPHRKESIAALDAATSAAMNALITVGQCDCQGENATVCKATITPGLAPNPSLAPTS